MQPIITQQSTITFEKRDAAISQATQIVELMKTLKIDNAESYKSAITELLLDVLPLTSSNVANWSIDPKEGEEGGSNDEF